ncbi:hypothetical protein S7711_05262 [Stachybotrys chartarum IBT 7711]|uniref:Uncharacterized protein n=1 Tax=Stachybotrys chartarum (strain CBS 109288 / IBT 7711) TaxID=1280523 RepID=A0A084AGL5_STACB|nr:hypothetical protein S7711_05262 [Stachybotrys chartarum IBT 7711]
MPNWKELGEIPDSEDEDGAFDSQDLDPATAPSIDRTKEQTHDIWDIPSSPNLERTRLSAFPSKEPPASTRAPSAAPSTVDSSPLSSPPSEHELPPVEDILLLRYDSQERNESPELQGRDVGTDAKDKAASQAKNGSSSLNNASDDELSGPRSALSGKGPSIVPPEESYPHIEDNSDEEARQAAIRHERSLRPRKPIQRHPYLLEDAYYSSTFKKHGLKPLRMTAEATQSRRQAASQDHNFEEESQESVLPPIAEESQTSGSAQSDGGIDGLLVLSSSPPETSPQTKGPGVSSQTSSRGETDTTSLHDYDLPDLDDLMTLPPRLVPMKQLKRKSPTPPPSTARKRRRRYVVDSDPPDTTEQVPERPRTSDSPDPLFASPSKTADVPTSLMDMDTPAPELTSLADESVAILRQAQPYSIDSDPDTGAQDADDRAESDDATLGRGSQSDSDSELVNKVGRRIRGVLPASWLRLDQKTAQDKARKDASNRRRDPSQEPEPRRGVAQRRQAAPGSTANQFLFDDSDEEVRDDGPVATVDKYPVQTKLALQPFPDLAVEPESISDDDGSVMEDDVIDHMLPALKRQLRLSESFRSAHKRLKTSHKPSGTPLRKVTKQPRITNIWNSDGRSASAVHRKAHREPRTGVGQTRSHRPKKEAARPPRNRVSSPPRLSILDVIDKEAPRFLKIAARTAKQRSGRGRARASQKSIQLATRSDHIDAMSVLNEWKAGSIKQRPAVSSAIGKRPAPGQNKRTLSQVSGNVGPKPKPASTEPSRRLVKQVNSKGSISFTPKEHDVPMNQSPTKRTKADMQRSHSGSVRPAQLEMEETESATSFGFQSGKRFLDRMYRKKHQSSTYAGSIAPTEATPNRFSSHLPTIEKPPTTKEDRSEVSKVRRRKKGRPERIDLEAPEYAYANDPLPIQNPPAADRSLEQPKTGKLLGLGPYGTYYTHHFEVFPLHSRVYFHESTLIGSGVIEAIVAFHEQNLMTARPRMSFNLGEKTLRWDSWTDQVSSELGIVLDFVAEQIEGYRAEPLRFDPTCAVAASTFVMKYIKDSLSFADETDVNLFIARMHECLKSFDDRTAACVGEDNGPLRVLYEAIMRVYDRLLLIVLLLLQICRKHPSLMNEQFQMEDLTKKVAKTAASVLRKLGMSSLRSVYGESRKPSFCERGLRQDSPEIHSWVVLMKVMDHASIPRTSFWEIAMPSSGPVLSAEAAQLESEWEQMFLLLPIVEFNDVGVVISGRRFDVATDGWALPQRMLKRVFQLYQENPRQSPSFNNYCRALIGRCHFLVQQWGWRKSAPVIGVIFDFFGSQNLSHLRNEEVHNSPRFLDELARRPKLDLEPEDRCFHVFLKLLALSIRKLKETGSIKDIRNLVARTTPNHNRQYLKEQNVHERDLAALRNHHDLLCTLFWAAPPEHRPGLQLIERLVIPASSHKEACLINLRAWKQLAQFVVASGEAATSFRAFAQWRDAFFQQTMEQFDSVARDIQQQLLSLPKDVVQTIDSAFINTMELRNKTAVQDVLYLSLASSCAVLRNAPDLETAALALNVPQLQQVFQRFSSLPPDLSWSLLEEALRTLDLLSDKIDKVQDEESQQSESQILSSTQVDGAVLTFNSAIARDFFGMARKVMSIHREPQPSTSDNVHKSCCMDMVVELSAKFCAKLIDRGIIRLADMFKPGKYGLFEGGSMKAIMERHPYLVLFVANLLKNGVEDFSDAGFTSLEIWATSIVRPRDCVRYEQQFAEQLKRREEKFIPEDITKLTIQPDYNANRYLFYYAVTSIRSTLRDAGPSVKAVLLFDYAKVLRLVMEQMKADLKDLANRPVDHHAYIVFVRDVVSLIRTHGSDVCPVDDFFFQISKDYSPPAQDPQLQVAGMTAYGIRVGEGDARAAQQLFFFLFASAKRCITSDNLGNEAQMLQRGMKDVHVLDFVLGEMFPAIIQATVVEDLAFPLLDIYVEALWRLLHKHVVAHELVDNDLPKVRVVLTAILRAMAKIRDSLRGISQAHLHVIRQLLAVVNLLRPSIRVLSMARPTPPAWSEVHQYFRFLYAFSTRAEEDLRSLMEDNNGVVDPALLFAGLPTLPAAATQLSARVEGFAKNMTDDVRRNWILADGLITIPMPGKGRGVPSTQSSQGIRSPAWNTMELVWDLYGRVREFRHWWQEVDGVKEKLQLSINAIF